MTMSQTSSALEHDAVATLLIIGASRGLPRSGPAIDGSTRGIPRFLMESNPRVEPKFPLLVVGISGTLRGEDVMVRQIEELLLLTCLGGFVAGITYAVTLLH
jgi:hypothetical protein